MLLVNRSPVVAPVRIAPGSDKRLAIWGCNLDYIIDRVSPGASYDVVLAVTSPAVPVTTEGKEPDLEPLWGTIEPALAKAMRKAHHRAGGGAQARRHQGGLLRGDGRSLPESRRRLGDGQRPSGLLRGPPAGAGAARPRGRARRPVLHAAPAARLRRRASRADRGLGHRLGRARPPRSSRIPGPSSPSARCRCATTCCRVAIGTADLISVDASLYPTLGPENRFKTLLYIEKEGFDPLLRKARIAERFDCAVMSTKGMSVTAARQIVDRYAQQGVRILVAHDFDRSGACIAHTLGNDTRRYSFEADPEVVDLGLSLAEARAMGLLDEAAPKEGPGEDKLREYGLGEEEIDFLIRQGRRVELNAMTSDQFVAWLEGKLAEHGAGKVVPEAEVLERHARRVLARRLAADRVRPLIEEAEADAAGAVLPVGLGDRVLTKLEEERELSWDEALEDVLADVTPPAGRSAS